MADEMKLDEASAEALRAFAAETVAERAARPPGRSASDAINEDPAPRPYSLRLTAREIHRLRVISAAASLKPSELARQFILEGLLRMEGAATSPSGSVEPRRITALKLAILGAYDLVADLERGEAQGA